MHRSLRHLRAVLVLSVVSVLLTACTAPDAETPVELPRDDTSAHVPSTEPQYFEGGSATQNLPYFSQVVRKYAEGKGAIEGTPIVNALAAAGFDKSMMQVSFDRTETGLIADNIFASVRIDEECLIVQIVSSNRSFVVAQEPALGPQKDICIIGDTRTIDW